MCPYFEDQGELYSEGVQTFDAIVHMSLLCCEPMLVWNSRKLCKDLCLELQLVLLSLASHSLPIVEENPIALVF